MDGTGPDLLEALRRYWRMVVLVAVAGVALSGMAAYGLRGSSAFAEGTVALTSPSAVNVLAPGAQGDATLARYTSQRALFMKSDAVLSVAAQQVPGLTVGKLRDTITTTPSQTSTSVAVHADAKTPREAIALVDALVAAYRQETAKQVSDRTSAALDSIAESSTRLRQTLSANPTQATAQSAATALAELTRQGSALQADSAVYGDGVDFVQAAGPQSAGSAGLPLRQLALGGLLGFAVAATIAWLRADRHRVVAHADEVSPVLGAVRLGVLPRWSDPLQPPYDRAPVTRHARDVLAPLTRNGVPKVILVTAAARRAGCTSLALGMTTALAAEGHHVLLLDADPSEHGASSAFGLEGSTPGFMEAVLHDHADSQGMLLDIVVGAGLKATLLPAGDAHERQVPTSGVRNALDVLRPAFDVVVVDAGLLDGSVLSPAVAALADAVVVVVRGGTTSRAVREERELLELNGAHVEGYVYNEA